MATDNREIDDLDEPIGGVGVQVGDEIGPVHAMIPRDRTEIIAQAIARARAGRVFRRAREIVIMPEGQCVTDAVLIGLIESTGAYMISPGKERAKTTPGRDIRIAVAMRLAEIVPEITAIWPVPCLTPDWRVIETGHDPETGIYVTWAGGPLPALSVAAARGLLDDVIDGFRFVGATDKANAIGYLALAALRPAIDGATPIHVMSSASAESGKTYLAHVILAMILDPRLATTEISEWSGEQPRQLVVAVEDQPPAVIFDDIPMSVLSKPPPLLKEMLTTGPRTPIKTRRMGGGRIELPIGCIWAATSLDQPATGEMARRMVPVRLTKLGAKRPEKVIDRALVISAILTLARTVFGQSPREQSIRGYAAWASVVATVIEAYDPALGAAFCAAEDRPEAAELSDLRALVTRWIRNAYAEIEPWPRAMTAKEIGVKCSIEGLALESLNIAQGSIALGRVLARLARQCHVIDGYRFEAFRGEKSLTYGITSIIETREEE